MAIAFNKELMIFGAPIETEMGDFHFLTMKEYLDLQNELALLVMNRLHIIYAYKEIDKYGEFKEFINMLNELSLYDIIQSLPEFKNAYEKIIDKVFIDDSAKENVFASAMNLAKFRETVMLMNCMQEEEVSPDHRVQRALERSRRVRQLEGDKTTITDIATSLMVGSNIAKTYQDLLECTVFQYYATYYRIAQFKNFEISSLMATVAEKVSIELWSKHVDMFEKESSALSENQFQSSYGGLFS